MDNHLVKEVWLWLKQSHIKISLPYLIKHIKSHPRYPSLQSITDTLDLLEVKTQVLKIPKVTLNEYTGPFLIHLGGAQNQFKSITSVAELAKDSSLFDSWDGILVLAEMQQMVNSVDHQKYIYQESSIRRFKYIASVLPVLLLLYSIGTNISIIFLTKIISIILALIVTVSIIQKQSGTSSKLSDRLCRTGENFDCDSILNHPKATLPYGIQFSDLCVAHFVTLLLLLTFARINSFYPQFIAYQYLSSLTSIAGCLFALYLQAFTIKKWCPLCLLISLLLLIQIFVIAGQYPFPSLRSILSTETTIATSIYSIMLWVWVAIIRPLWNSSNTSSENYFEASRIKLDPLTLSAQLGARKHIPTAVFPTELQIGHHDSPIQLTVALHPYCRPCQNAHQSLETILNTTKVGLTLRFVVNLEDSNDPGRLVAEHIVNLFSRNTLEMVEKQNILSSWYSLNDFLKFQEKYPAGDASPGQTGMWSKGWANPVPSQTDHSSEITI